MTASLPQTVHSLPSKSVLAKLFKEYKLECSFSQSFPYLLLSIGLTYASGFLFLSFLPFSWFYFPLWFLYAFITGSFAVGCWVIAHECGHGAFCKTKWLQHVIGFVIHSFFLVPYFTWRQSHRLHHAFNSHLDLGETHVPVRDTSFVGQRYLRMAFYLKPSIFASVNIFIRLFIGWPLYLLCGVTGGHSRYGTSHLRPLKFWNLSRFSSRQQMLHVKSQIIASNLGVIFVMLILLYLCVIYNYKFVLFAYFGPYLVVNCWIAIYTWLHHVGDHVCHFDSKNWSWSKGASMTVDRDYHPVINFLHHNIGRFHVVHHFAPSIPHYHLARATKIFAECFPKAYFSDHTFFLKTIWYVALNPSVVKEAEGCWRLIDLKGASKNLSDA